MENLEKHITRLINRHNCVIIPGFGAFLAHNVPASYNKEEQLFIPPHRTLGFNSQVTVDDALLVSDYMKTGNHSYEKATDIMNNDIAMLRNTLTRKGEVCFGSLGIFSMDINGTISFEPDTNGIDDAENFGFEPLSISELQSQREKVIVINRHDLRKYVAAAAAIILTFLFVTPVSDKMFNNNLKASLSDFASSEQISLMQQVTASAPKAASISDCEIIPVESSSIASAVTVASETEETSIETNAVTEPVLSSEQPKHYIIVASSPNADNAQLAIKELGVKMSAEYSIVKCGKRHRIAIECFDTVNEAQNALAEYQTTFPDAWVLTY